VREVEREGMEDVEAYGDADARALAGVAVQYDPRDPLAVRICRWRQDASVSQPGCLPGRKPAWLSNPEPGCPSVHQSACLPAYLPACLSACVPAAMSGSYTLLLNGPGAARITHGAEAAT
jgi:hypothetical protein